MSDSALKQLPLRELLLGAAGVLAARLLGALVQFVFYLVIGRRFGAEGFGLFVLALTVSVVASTIGRWGLDQLALRQLSAQHAHGEHSAFRAILLRCAMLVALLSVLVAAAMWLLAGPMAQWLFERPELSQMLQIFALSIPFMSLLQLASESIRAKGQPLLSALLQTGLVPLVALALLVLDLHQHSIVSAAAVYLVAIVAALIAASLVLVIGSPSLLSPVAGGPATPAMGRLLAFATPIAWVAIISVWLGFSETVLLAAFRSAEEVGLYAAALRLVLLLNFLILSFNSVLAPQFAVLERSGDLPQVRRLARYTTGTMLLVASPFVLALLVFPGALLALFGDEFRVASSALMILTAGQLINLGTGPVGTILLMTGHERIMRRHTVIAAVVNLGAAIVLIPAFGINGAACSAAIGMAALNLLAWRSVRRLHAATSEVKPSATGSR